MDCLFYEVLYVSLKVTTEQKSKVYLQNLKKRGAWSYHQVQYFVSLKTDG